MKFITKSDQLEFLVSTMGAYNTSRTFQTLMIEVVFEYMRELIIPYADGSLIFSR